MNAHLETVLINERSGATAKVATAVKAVLYVATWPARLLRARRNFALIAGLSEHELKDIGLTPQDGMSVTALDADEDPTVHLARMVTDRRRRRKTP